ncbi:MAG: NapC/NirT family cytochrome c [Coriobacteriia bacterium]|nr:NapC/NirT family cytochrome c [Coriobacteriia bacterium]
MLKWILGGTIAAVLVAASVFGVWYTEQPAFCPTCHEMGPYEAAWRTGPHSDISCLSCHVEEGFLNHVKHKPVALKEVWDHFTRKPVFPRYDVEIPDHRCTECHESVVSASPPNFSHEKHVRAGECWQCHLTAGHRVTPEALSAVGVLNSNTVESSAAASGILPRVDSTAQTLSEHPQVSCGECHDMQEVGCAYCHEAPADHFESKTCTECHSASTPFDQALFSHTGDLKCDNCHKAPSDHFVGVPCANCHSPKVAFADASFRHPSVGEEHSYRSFPCTDCHPKDLASVSCEKCHRGGVPIDD